MDDGVWKAVKELKNRVDVLERAYNETIDRYNGNFKILEDRAKDLGRIVTNNAQVVIADEKDTRSQIASLRAVVNTMVDGLDHNKTNAKFTKVWCAIGVGSLIIFMLCKKLQKIENRIDAIEEEKDKR